MAGLVRQLLAADQGADRTAQRLFEKAVQRTQQRRAKSSELIAWNLMWDADEIASELEWLLRGELFQVNLLDSMQYHRLFTAIYDWRPQLLWPDHAAALQRCGFVQNGLLALLPQLKRHQQLVQICQDYRQYLVLTAAQQLKSRDQPLVSVQSIAVAPLPTTKTSMTASSADLDLLKIGKKIQAVNNLQCALSTRQDVDSQYRAFKQVFTENRVIIETGRDNAAVKFIKAVVTVISAGLAAWLGIWGVQGQKTTQQIDQVLQRSIS